MQILPLLVANSGSLESVKKAIQHLKDTDNWISNCDDAYMALATTFRQHKHDMLSLLVQEGLTVSMKFLSYLVFSLSLESVKIAIQNLKSNANWDSKNDDAFRALDLAYNKKEYDVFDMLVNQVFIGRWKVMSGVVNDVSLEVVKKGIQYLKDTNIWNSTCDDALEALVITYSTQRYDVCVLLVQEGFKLTAKNLPAVVVSSQSLESVNKAIQHLKDNNNWDSKSNYALIALLFAYIHQKYDVCSLLVQEGLMVAMQILPHLVANSGSLESVKKAIQHMKDTGNWISKCDDAFIALVIAFSRQKHDILSLLVQEGLTFTMKILPYVVHNMTLEYVKIAIRNLKDNANWDSTYEEAFRVLELAYNKKEYDVFDMLLNQGFTLARKSIYGVVYDVSLEFVQKTIQYLKDTHKWDSSCDDALDALVIAFSHQRFDVCALLIQEGFKLTVKNLPALVTNSLSLESIKRAIQHLKDTGNWDPKTDDAYKALMIAYSQRKHDVCVLLFQEGLTYAMKILPGVVPNSVSSESDQRAVQHLKDSDSSDPNSNDAPSALSCCYSQQKHDVSAMPVHVGLTLTMQNLLGMVKNSESLESIEKAIQHMKYTNNWDAKSDDAIIALVIAYSQQRYDVCVLLVQAGLILAMKILPSVVANSVSSESVKKAIQHLKDTGNWDSMSDDALIALVFAYIQQKYDVCILLVKEGLALTMQIFPEIVANSVALESVTNAIKHLKDTGNWNSNCDDAYKALVFAFTQQKHDILSLLVQEGIKVTMRILPYVVYNVSLECVRKAMQNMKDNDNWNSKCEDAFRALEHAYNIKDYDAFDMLVQQIFTLGWKSISGFLYDVSLEFVTKTIQYLKNTKTWNSNCDDALKALVFAYSKQRYDVCALLVQEGFKLAVKNLPAVVVHSLSLEPVSKAIQHLKDTDNWDFRCADALTALVFAYIHQRYDVCVLLFQEGLKVTMKILPPLVANIVSLEPLEKAIQHLKDTDNWDSKCDDASAALVICYVKQKHELSVMLVHEGFTLTMKHLPDVVRDSTSLESVKKTIHHLKDTNNWDCMVHDALKALVIAYIQQKDDVCGLLSQEGLKVTMKILPLLVANIVSLEPLEKAIQHLKDTNNWDSKCDDASAALVSCYVKQKHDMSVMLLHEGITLSMKHLPDVIRGSKSLKSVKKTIHHLKDIDNWDCMVHDALKALVIAYIQQKYDVCVVLFQEGLTTTMKILPLLVANTISLEPLEKAIQHLKDTDNWDSKCDDASAALVICYVKQKQALSVMLVQEGFTLTMKHLPDVVRDSTTLESVKKAIHHLKDTNNWDSKCDDASEALVICYVKQKHDMAVILVHEGLTLTMKHLPDVVSDSTSLKSVQKAIQHLKDTDNWDCMVHDAVKGLVIAYIQQKYDVCGVLFQEGLKVTMKILPLLVANLVSLEPLEKAIQHLKDTNNWDSKSDDASLALAFAYSQQKYDVVDLLVLEEVALTMKNLPHVVDNGSLESVKEAMQHLKDADSWDSTCTNATQALETAYIKNKIDVLDLLAEENVTLSMKHLPGVVISTLTEYVRKAIQSLKDTGNWDSDSNDASKALEMAWKHLCGICDLLLHEGVTLTMKNLPGVVVNSVSLESINKAIQHLKDTGNWDSRCDDASKILEIVWEQKHEVCNLLLHEEVALTMRNLHGVVLNSSSLYSVKNAIQHLKDTDNWDSKSNDAQIAVEFAYRAHKYDVVDLLVQEGATLTMKNLPGVVCDVSLEYVKKTIQHLKDNDNWDPKCNDASTALEIAYRLHKYDVIDLLVQEGFVLTMKNFFGVVADASLKYVEKVMQDLKNTGKWDPKCACASAALEIAYRHPVHDVFDLLVQEGITLIIMCLPDLVLTESLESVKKVIQLLKDTYNWDPNCDDASKALENAYIKQDYSVGDLLVQEGVALAMKNLPIVVDHMSLKAIEKAMQHLKDTGTWDPKSDHAAKALETALSRQKYDVFTLLVQEGVTLTMKNIPGVVDSVSLKSVEKAVQHLKETGNWDPRCDDASKALELGWKQKHVFDLLVQEGITLTMKNLPLMVYHMSLESIKKAVQHLKDNDNWDSKCDDASEALEIAYSKEKYKVIDLLVKEGVTLTMKNVPHMVDSASLEPIKKAIQHLKDTNSWNPKCEHASTALETALAKQKYHVFDLCVQEGITLTMKNFPGVVESVSVKSVKKAIQHLNDTGNWNSKCDDASRAFEIAWKKQCYLCDLLVKEGVTFPMKTLLPVAETISYEEVEQYWSSTCAIMNPRELMHLKEQRLLVNRNWTYVF